MADIDYDPHFHAPPRFDGSPSCVLCHSTRDEAGHGWCPAAQCLVCDDCCRGLMAGDLGRIVAVAFGTGVSLDPPRLYNGCERCPRGHLRFAERIMAAAHEPETAPC